MKKFLILTAICLTVAVIPAHGQNEYLNRKTYSETEVRDLLTSFGFEITSTFNRLPDKLNRSMIYSKAISKSGVSLAYDPIKTAFFYNNGIYFTMEFLQECNITNVSCSFYGNYITLPCTVFVKFFDLKHIYVLFDETDITSRKFVIMEAQMEGKSLIPYVTFEIDRIEENALKTGFYIPEDETAGLKEEEHVHLSQWDTESRMFANDDLYCGTAKAVIGLMINYDAEVYDKVTADLLKIINEYTYIQKYGTMPDDVSMSDYYTEYLELAINSARQDFLDLMEDECLELLRSSARNKKVKFEDKKVMIPSGSGKIFDRIVANLEVICS